MRGFLMNIFGDLSTKNTKGTTKDTKDTKVLQRCKGVLLCRRRDYLYF